MGDERSNDGRLDSWKDIAKYLNFEERTVKRWEKTRGLPIRRMPGGSRSKVYSYRSELDRWLASGEGEGRTAVPTSNLEAPADAIGTTAASFGLSIPNAEPSPIAFKLAPSSWRRLAGFTASGFAAALIIIFIANRYVEQRRSLQTIQLSNLQQLTANGVEKTHLLFDGSRLYFGQEENGWYALAAMPAEGGTVASLWNPKMNIYPEDVAPDGRQLLALTCLGIEREKSIWIVPLKRGAPYPLAGLKAHSAGWSPDGKTIAYAMGESIYLTSRDGDKGRRIARFTSIPDTLRWSADGHRLRFLLLDSVTERPTYWELVSTDGMVATTLHSLPLTINTTLENWSRETPSDATFVSNIGNEDGLVWKMQYGDKWGEAAVSLTQLHAGIGANRGIAFDASTSRIYLLSELPARNVAVRFDPIRQQAKRILPGVSAVFVDYSKDSKWVTYVRLEDQTLWASQADGTGARQLTEPSMGPVELPRWSPDGSVVAYMTKRPNAPWRIYTTLRDGGPAREASEGNDNQGAPTWSPDGNYIVYGNVECQATHTCALHQINLATQRDRTLPGSEGLGTARWSPDGKYIAAMAPERHQLFLFETNTQRWAKLADGTSGTDLSWSSDSRFLYTNLPGNDAKIVRIAVSNGATETVVDLRAQDEFDLANVPNELNFSLAPDNGIIMRRRMQAAEIFAYTLRSQ